MYITIQFNNYLYKAERKHALTRDILRLLKVDGWYLHATHFCAA